MSWKKWLLLSFILLAMVMVQKSFAQEPSAPAPPDAAVSLFFQGNSFLGIYPEEITRENMARYNLREARGVGITRVSENSPAERAGLKAGDVITKFDGEPVGSVRKLNRLISEVAPDHTVRLTISRGGNEQEVSATLSKRQDFPRELESMPDTFSGDVLRGFNSEALRKRLEEMGAGGDMQVMSFGMSRRIGVTTEQLTKQLADYFGVAGGRGLLITNVSENSPAARAGLKAGDVITEVEGQKVETTLDLTRAINRKDDGEITINFLRDKGQRSVKLTPERNSSPRFDSPDFYVAPRIGELTIPRLDSLVIPRVETLTIPHMNIEPMMRNFSIPRQRIRPPRVLISSGPLE